MNAKPDRECEERSDIVLLSDIIANSRYWQSALPLLTPSSPTSLFFQNLLEIVFIIASLYGRQNVMTNTFRPDPIQRFFTLNRSLKSGILLHSDVNQVTQLSEI
jgi:hypothetical protein